MSGDPEGRARRRLTWVRLLPDPYTRCWYMQNADGDWFVTETHWTDQALLRQMRVLELCGVLRSRCSR